MSLMLSIETLGGEKASLAIVKISADSERVMPR